MKFTPNLILMLALWIGQAKYLIFCGDLQESKSASLTGFPTPIICSHYGSTISPTSLDYAASIFK
jgi:hypothetical protein